MSFSNEPVFDEPKTNSIENALSLRHNTRYTESRIEDRCSITNINDPSCFACNFHFSFIGTEVSRNSWSVSFQSSCQKAKTEFPRAELRCKIVAFFLYGFGD